MFANIQQITVTKLCHRPIVMSLSVFITNNWYHLSSIIPIRDFSFWILDSNSMDGNSNMAKEMTRRKNSNVECESIFLLSFIEHVSVLFSRLHIGI